MECISNLVTSTVPNYFKGLPIPKSFGGWFKLSFKEYMMLIPPTAATAGVVYITYLAFCPHARADAAGGSCKINKKIKKSEPKVVDSIDIEDITKTTAYCRCWKSKSFPLCDGAHNDHNKECSDNIGPVVIAKK